MSRISDMSRLWTDSWADGRSNDNRTINEEFTCATSDYDTNVSDMLGRTHSDIIELVGDLPAGKSFLYCTFVNVSTMGDAKTTGGPLTVKLDAQFETRTAAAFQGQIEDDSWSDWIEHWETSGEAITIGEGFRASDAAAVADCTPIQEDDISAVRLFPSTILTLTGKTSLITAGVKSDIASCEGKINDQIVNLKGVNYDTGHLLFMGGDLQEGRDSEGGVVHDVTYKISNRYGNTWNEFYWKGKAGGPGFIALVDDSGNPVYTSIDFQANLDPSGW